LAGRGLCDELITRPEESYRLCCVVVCDLETSRMGAPYIYDISRLRVNLSLTSAPDVGGCSTPRPGRFALGKESQYPSHRRVVGPQGQSGRMRKVSPLPGFEP